MRNLILVVTLLLSNCAFHATDSFSSNENHHMIERMSKSNSEKDQYQEAYQSTLALWPVPYEEIDIPTSYGSAHIIKSGMKNAPAAVLLHGMNSSSTMWYPNIAAITETHAIYAIDDITEPGRSKLSRPMNSIDDLVDWYIELLDKTGLKQFTLIGASKGGWLAVKIALRIPERVEKLILLSPLQTFSNIKPNMKFLTALSYAVSPNGRRLQNVMKAMSANTTNIDPRYKEQFLLGSRIAENQGVIFKFRPFSSKQLQNLTMPLLILVGDQDIINKKTLVEKACESLPDAETSVIAEAGHFLSMDQTRITNTKISEFMNSYSAASMKQDDAVSGMASTFTSEKKK